MLGLASLPRPKPPTLVGALLLWRLTQMALVLVQEDTWPRARMLSLLLGRGWLKSSHIIFLKFLLRFLIFYQSVRVLEEFSVDAHLPSRELFLLLRWTTSRVLKSCILAKEAWNQFSHVDALSTIYRNSSFGPHYPPVRILKGLK